MINKIEQNLLGHFKYLPERAKFNVRTENNLTIIHCGLSSSMFNIVYGTCLIKKIDQVIDEFKEQPFAWWIGPSHHDPEFSQALINHGFISETTEYAMLCELSHIPASTLEVQQVLTSKQLDDFIKILEPYDPSARIFYENLQKPILQDQERLFVGYENNTPVIIALLFKEGDAVGIFSLLTKEDKRGRGFGTQMMMHLMKTAQEWGAKYATLSASSDSGFRIYESLGFKTFGKFECFEWAGI